MKFLNLSVGKCLRHRLLKFKWLKMKEQNGELSRLAQDAVPAARSSEKDKDTCVSANG